MLDKDEPQLIVEGEGGYRVLSRSWEELASMMPGTEGEAMEWFIGKLRMEGIFRQMKASGATAGSVLRIGSIELIYEEG